MKQRKALEETIKKLLKSLLKNENPQRLAPPWGHL